MNKVVVCGSQRTPFVKSHGHYKNTSLRDLLSASLQQLVKAQNLQGHLLDDVIGGAVVKSSRNFNLVREAVLSTDLDPNTPGLDIQRACGTSLEATLLLANKIRLGQAQSGIACGVDSHSTSPFETSSAMAHLYLRLYLARSTFQRLKVIAKFRPSMLTPVAPSVNEPRTQKSMGQHCELMAKQWEISREDQDKWAYESQQKASKAYENGFFKDLIFEYRGQSKDQFIRPDSTLEKMSQLRPAFDKKAGTLTAANSTPLTDGSSAVLLASEEFAKKNQWPLLAYVEDGQSSAVDFVHGEGLLMAPTQAVSQLLKRNHKTLQDFQIYEIHEAFAAQVLCNLKAWNDPKYCENKLGFKEPLGIIDNDRINIQGGSLAIGHPFAATGARLVGSAAKCLSHQKNSQALLTACTAGGMGVALILSSPDM